MSDLPQHIGIIMDGNRRWAKEKGLPTFEGHRRGYNKIKEVGDWCLKRGIKTVTVYAFSTENWKRSKKEVNYLMGLLKRFARKEVNFFNKRNVKIKFIGRINELASDIKKAINNIEEKTKNNTRALFNVALNYGGRAEIIDAVKKIIKEKISAKKIDEKLISSYLYTKDLPDPDFIIRTSGEKRLSSFLLWQGSYAELCFYPAYWPAFSEKDFDECLLDFAKRKRRFGGN
ncbi:MAG: polyprenyl diphosphate synthase [bacterium]|nr:polyprenyl diphosphate synthase [bacterium]